MSQRQSQWVAAAVVVVVHTDRCVKTKDAYEADGQVKAAVELLEAVVKVQDTLAADHPERCRR
jgi:hypothetical protein